MTKGLLKKCIQAVSVWTGLMITMGSEDFELRGREVKPGLETHCEGGQWQALSVSGIQLCYRTERGRVHLRVTAPTRGWVAVGFNSRNDIVGCDLKMFAVEGHRLRYEDQIVLAPGKHPAKATIGPCGK